MGRQQGGELTTPGARGITTCKLLCALWALSCVGSSKFGLLGPLDTFDITQFTGDRGTEEYSCLQRKKLASLARTCCYRSGAAGRGSQIHQVVLEPDTLHHVKKSSWYMLQTLCYWIPAKIGSWGCDFRSTYCDYYYKRFRSKWLTICRLFEQVLKG